MKCKTSKVISFLMVLVCVFSILNIQQPTQVHAWSNLELKTTMTSKTKVKLSWEKKSVSYYRVYRASRNKNGECGKFKQITTLSKNRTSYTTSVRYKKYYCYKVCGYNKKGKLICSGENDVFSGVSNVFWYEYQWCDAKISPTAIPLTWWCDNGLKPNGYEIYRSENGKTYKKIKTLKNVYKYTDKTVKAKHTYYYKIRSYCMISGKKVYGAYSEPVKHSAVNKDGKYFVNILPGEGAIPSSISGSSVIAPIITSPASICMIVISDAMNGDLQLNREISWDADFTFKAEDGKKHTEYGSATSHIYQLKGDTWQEVKDKTKVTIKPEETFYIRFDFEKENMKDDIASASAVTLESYDGGIWYNGFESLICFTLPEEKTFMVRINGEGYH